MNVDLHTHTYPASSCSHISYRDYIARCVELQVEAVALTVDGVTEAAAVGAPSRKRGHDIELFICGDATSAAVLDRCSRALPKHAVPVRVTRVGSLPTSPSGKVRKRDLL